MSDEKVIVVFTKSHGIYGSGERAGFSVANAHALVSLGVARLSDPTADSETVNIRLSELRVVVAAKQQKVNAATAELDKAKAEYNAFNRSVTSEEPEPEPAIEVEDEAKSDKPVPRARRKAGRPRQGRQ